MSEKDTDSFIHFYVHEHQKNDSTFRIKYHTKYFSRAHGFFFYGLAYKTCVTIFREVEDERSIDFYDFTKGDFRGSISVPKSVNLEKCKLSSPPVAAVYKSKILMGNCNDLSFRVYDCFLTYKSGKFVLHLTNGSSLINLSGTYRFTLLRNDDVVFVQNLQTSPQSRILLFSKSWQYRKTGSSKTEADFLNINALVNHFALDICLLLPHFGKLDTGFEVDYSPQKPLSTDLVRRPISLLKIEINTIVTQSRDTQIGMDIRGNIWYLYSIADQNNVRHINHVQYFKKISA
jgi:hypothetical protein